MLGLQKQSWLAIVAGALVVAGAGFAGIYGAARGTGAADLADTSIVRQVKSAMAGSALGGNYTAQLALARFSLPRSEEHTSELQSH